MKRTAIPDQEVFIEAIQDEISRTPEGRYFHRLHAVLNVLKGSSPAHTADIYGDSPRAVQYWVKNIASKGLAGLWDKNRPGRPPKLSENEQEKLRKEIRRSPREFGYDQNLWDGPLLSHHLKERYGIVLGIRQCQRLFNQLGFTLQRPRRKACESDPQQQEEFKKTLPS
jgi:transposase